MSNPNDEGVIVAEPEEKTERKHAPTWNVVLLNDDFTPMDFVVEVLKVLFGHNEEAATMIMFDVHKKGKGIAGTYSRDVAETKAAQVKQVAQQNEHPLQAVIEPNS